MYVLWKNNVVMKEIVQENNRQAAKTLLTIYYGKWYDSILQICPGQTERQWSVNNFWTCKSCNWNVIWLLLFIITVFAAVIGKNAIDDIATIFWKSASKDHEWFLVFYAR